MGNPVPDWLPDWRDVDAYPDPNETSTQEWAWEFLRRNSAYQQAYENYQVLLQNLAQNEPDLQHLLQSPRAKGGYSTPLHFLKEDPVAHAFLEITPEIISFCNPVHSKFRVRAPSGLPDPAKPYSIATPVFLLRGSTKVYDSRAKMMLSINASISGARDDTTAVGSDISQLDLNKEEVIHGITKKPTEALFKIDWMYNYSGELQEIGRYLQRKKERFSAFEIGKRINKQQEYDPDLLVVYDAKTQNISNRDLAKHIFPYILREDESEAGSRVNKLYQRAKQLVDGGYKRLASI